MAVSLHSRTIHAGSDRVLIAAGLFFVCAVLSAVGGGLLGLLCFVPAVVAVEAGQSLSQNKSEHFDNAKQ